MDRCEECGGKVRETIAPVYEDKLLGLPGVKLIDSVSIGTCEMCGAHAYTTIPNLSGMIAAAAIKRVMIPVKLTAVDVKFVRKALGLTARELADLLEVRAESISRWENGKEPIGPASEKLLRLTCWINLHGDAPLIEIKASEIAGMKIRGVRSQKKPVAIRLQCVRQTAKKNAWDDAA